MGRTYRQPEACRCRARCLVPGHRAGGGVVVDGSVCAQPTAPGPCAVGRGSAGAPCAVRKRAPRAHARVPYPRASVHRGTLVLGDSGVGHLVFFTANPPPLRRGSSGTRVAALSPQRSALGHEGVATSLRWIWCNPHWNLRLRGSAFGRLPYPSGSSLEHHPSGVCLRAVVTFTRLRALSLWVRPLAFGGCIRRPRGCIGRPQGLY